jgi:single-stranded DNA-binding protein
MQPKNWENKNGDTVYDTQVNVRNFNFVDPKEEGAGAGASSAKETDVPF